MMENKFRKHVAHVLEKTDLPLAWKDFLLSPLPAVIYGAGRQATVVYTFCLMFRKPVFCLITTDTRERWGTLPAEKELPLYLASEFPKEKDKCGFDLVIAINPQYNVTISSALRRRGWSRVTTIENWEKVNALTRELYYSAYFRWRGGRFLADADDAQYVECPYDDGVFKIFFNIDPVYKANLFGDIGTIAFPPIFGDFSVRNGSGPYEYGEVVLRRGDTVLDLGANIGLFSCVAASKGCVVHAIEPTPTTVEKYLRRNASLCGFTVTQKAVLDRTGMTDFFINESFDESLNITRHSVFPQLEPSYSRIAVETITVDSYVAENNIKQIDFIKSHTEYSEDFWPIGALNVIAAFTPRMAVFMRHPPGSAQAKSFEKIIKKVCPDYEFVYRWMTLFAWIPGK